MKDNYIDSNIDWMGLVPASWKKNYLKRLYSFEKGCNAALYTKEYIDDNEGIYPVYSGQTEDNGIMGRVSNYDYDLNECLFTTTVGAKVMTTKILSGKFCLSQNCLIMKPKDNINNRFYNYLLTSLFDYEKSLIPAYMQPSLRVEDLKRYSFYEPPRDVQNKISDYLDTRCNKIEEIINDNKKSIELLEEYKKSLINNLTIMGFDDNKSTSIPWLKNISSDASLIKAKYLFNVKTERNHPDAEVLSLYREYGIVPKDSRNDNFNVTSENTDNYKYVEKGDLVINKMKAWQGSLAVSDFEGIVSPAYHVCSFKTKKVNKKYIHYLLRTKMYSQEFERLSTGIRIGQWDLSIENFLSIPIVLPSINTQNQIVEYLDKHVIKIDKVIEYRKQIIEKLDEYKKSLIYEVVTGKKEV